MPKKIVKLSESDLEKLVTRIIKEGTPEEEINRKQTNFKKSEFNPYQREKDIMGAFGSYSDDIPVNVISYLRKNPRRFLKKIVDIYGMERVLDFIGYRGQ